MVILFLDFDKSQWQSIDKQRYIRSIVITVLVSAGHFRGDLKCVVMGKVEWGREINDTFFSVQQHFFIELPPQIII